MRVAPAARADAVVTRVFATTVDIVRCVREKVRAARGRADPFGRPRSVDHSICRQKICGRPESRRISGAKRGL